MGPSAQLLKPECSSEGTANLDRREEFQLASRVEQRGADRVFIKFPANAASRPFIDLIAEREKFAARQFRGQAEVVIGRRQDDVLVYPFLEAPNLEEQIGLEILQNRKDFALDSVVQYAHFLSGLPHLDCVPSQFRDFLGFKAMETAMTCVTFGPYDCIPRNLICDSSGWNVLDSEWTFSFAMPVDFLLWRGIHSLVFGLQQIIQARTNGKAPVILYQGYGRTRLYMPFAWYNAFELHRMDRNRFIAWEEYFARKILKPEAIRRGRLRLSKRNKVYASLPGPKSLLICYEELIKRATRVIQTSLRKTPC
jgi:hypothetical protein